MGNLRNTSENWGLVTIYIHWITAFVVIGLFISGLWMVEMTYYDDWYNSAPSIHKSIGILLFFLISFRLLWRISDVPPDPLDTHTKWERRLAHMMHMILYVLLFCIIISGYLISTADGRGISVFGWFEVPAFIYDIANQEDIAGEIHFYISVVLIGLVILHALAAIKHHIVDRDRTLKRMLK